jgi:hypothetical protein
VQKIPGVVDRVGMRRIRISLRFGGNEKVVIVNPENVITADEMK